MCRYTPETEAGSSSVHYRTKAKPVPQVPRMTAEHAGLEGFKLKETTREGGMGSPQTRPGQSLTFYGILEMWVQEGSRGAMIQPQPFVLACRGGRFRLIAKDAKNSKPTGQHLQGAVPLLAFSDHFYNSHDAGVAQGRVEVQGLIEDDPGWLLRELIGGLHCGSPRPPEEMFVGDVEERHSQVAFKLRQQV